MSLPSKYQKEITDKIINDFPELIFNKDNTILKKDEFFNLYVKIIKNASKIEQEIKELNNMFKLPYEQLLSFNTGRMVIDIDGLISETYRKYLKLKEQKENLEKKISNLENINKSLLNDLDIKEKRIEKLSEQLSICKQKTDEALKTIQLEKDEKKQLQKKCSNINKKYQEEVKKSEDYKSKTQKKITINKANLLLIREKLIRVNKKLNDYSEQIGLTYKSNNKSTKSTNNSNNNSNNKSNNKSTKSNNKSNNKRVKSKKKRKSKKKSNNNFFSFLN